MLMSFQNKELFQPVIMYLLLGDSLQYFEGIQPEYISLEWLYMYIRLGP